MAKPILSDQLELRTEGVEWSNQVREMTLPLQDSCGNAAFYHRLRQGFSSAPQRCNAAVLAGADRSGRVLMYTPNPYQGGSSVSHFDTSAFPNLLMEPNINGDLTHNVMPPWDLTLPLLKDIGWSINY